MHVVNVCASLAGSFSPVPRETSVVDSCIDLFRFRESFGRCRRSSDALVEGHGDDDPPSARHVVDMFGVMIEGEGLALNKEYHNVLGTCLPPGCFLCRMKKIRH